MDTGRLLQSRVGMTSVTTTDKNRPPPLVTRVTTSSS